MPKRRTLVAVVAVMPLLLPAACTSHRAVDEIVQRERTALTSPVKPGASIPLLAELNDANGNLSLAKLLKHAVERSPRLKRARAASAALRERRPQVTALPDPMLRLGWYAEEIETRTGPQQFSVGLTQEIPWPEKLSVAGAVADLQANQGRVREWIVGRDVLLDVTRSYQELNYLVRAERATTELATLWADLVARAAGSPTISAAEIARAETRLEQSRYDRKVLQELSAIERERLRALLELPDSTVIGDPVSIVLPALAVDLASLQAIVLRSNQEILLATLAVREAAAREELARLSLMPDFSVGGRYIATGQRPDGVSPAGNGNDPFVFELGIRLPLQRTAKRAAIAETGNHTRERAFARDELVQKLRIDLAEAFFKARNEARLLRLHDETLVPQAEHAAREAEAILENGQSGVAGLIETIAARHQVRLGALRARADYAIRLTRIEQIIGTPLVRVVSGTQEKMP